MKNYLENSFLNISVGSEKEIVNDFATLNIVVAFFFFPTQGHWVDEGF